MKKLLLFMVLCCQFCLAQMPNISSVWLNHSKPYFGTIGGENQQINVKINVSEQNKKNDQQYFVAGNTVVDRNNTKFEGNLTITKYKDGKKRSTVFGEYNFAEEVKGKHSGLFKGKFVYTFYWNKKTQKIEREFIEFIGDWKSYDGTLNYKTKWNNQ